MKRIVLLFLAMLPIAAHATVITQNLNVAFVCSGSTGPYPFTFSISDPTALTVTQNGTVLASTDYTMIAVNNNYENGGNVTLNSACPAAQTLVLTRSTPLTQATVFSDNMPVPMKSFERGLDKLTEIVQEQAGGGGSGLPAGCTSSSTGNISCTGTVNATSLTAQSVNGAINPLTYAGSDIAAKTSNAVSALGCSSTFPCNFVLPPSPQMSFSGTLTLTDSMTFSCTPAGESARQSAAQPPTLNYTGSGTAVVINGARAQFNGCGLAMGNATTGILIENQNAQINNVYTIGGNVGSVLVELGVSDNAQINQFTAFEFQGDGIWSHDNYDSTITNSLMYGYTIGGASGATNHTSRSLVMDSGTAGIHIKNFGGGDSGLHGIVVQDLHNPGHPPVQIFASDVISDCSYGDGLLFDSSLGVSAIVAEFDETWISAAGDSCNGTSIRGLTTANNVHISGGKGIHFIGGWFRSAANNPFLIDNSNAGDISITNAFLYGGNCFNNNTPSTVAGVNVTANIDGLLVDGNTDGFAEYCGNQGWGVLIGSGLTSMNNVRITNNDFYGNTVGSISAPAGFPLIQSGNVNSFLPELTAGTKTLLGGGPLGVWNNVNRNNAWLLPFDTTSGIGGLSVNGYFDGTNFIFPSDGISNGGTLIGMNYGGSPSFTFYCVPDSGSPTVTQTIAPGSMSADNCGSLSRAGFSAATVTDQSSLRWSPVLFSGSDACAKIANAAASLQTMGYNSGIIDACRAGITGTQACASSMFAGLSNNGTFNGELDTCGVQFVINIAAATQGCGPNGSSTCLVVQPGGWTWKGGATRPLAYAGPPYSYPYEGTSIQPSSAVVGMTILSLGSYLDNSAPQGTVAEGLAVSCLPPSGTYALGSYDMGVLNANVQQGGETRKVYLLGCQQGIDAEQAPPSPQIHSSNNTYGNFAVNVVVPLDPQAWGGAAGYCTSGSGATATPTVTGGALASVAATTPGSGYNCAVQTAIAGCTGASVTAVPSNQITINSLPANNDTLTITWTKLDTTSTTSTVITFVTSGATGMQVNIGATPTITAASLYTLLAASTTDPTLGKYTYTNPSAGVVTVYPATTDNVLSMATSDTGAISPVAGGIFGYNVYNGGICSGGTYSAAVTPIGVAGLVQGGTWDHFTVNMSPATGNGGTTSNTVSGLGTGFHDEASNTTIETPFWQDLGVDLDVGRINSAQNLFYKNPSSTNNAQNSLDYMVLLGPHSSSVNMFGVVGSGILSAVGGTATGKELYDALYPGGACSLTGATGGDYLTYYNRPGTHGALGVVSSSATSACGSTYAGVPTLAGTNAFLGPNSHAATETFTGVGGINITTTTAATSGGNVNSSPFSIQGNCWNGSASAACGLKFVATPATGTNPLVTMNVTSTNTGDAMYWYWGTTANPVQIAFYKSPWFYNVAGTYPWKYSFTGTASRNVFIPDGDSATAMATSFTTTSGTSDNVTITGMTSSGHCELEPTNASAATNLATTYVSAKASNQITVTHAATANMNYDVLCTSN